VRIKIEFYRGIEKVYNKNFVWEMKETRGNIGGTGIVTVK